MLQRKNTHLFKSIKALTLAAMFTALSVVIGIFCKNFMNFGMGLFRITFENLPIIMSGILFGPICGGAVGCASDLISYLLSSQVYPPNLIVTAGAISVGVCSGIVGKYIIRKNGNARIIASGITAHVIGSMIIKTVGLFSYYQWAVLWRIPTYCVISFIEILVICLIFKNKNFKRMTDDL